VFNPIAGLVVRSGWTTVGQPGTTASNLTAPKWVNQPSHHFVWLRSHIFRLLTDE
jgi:hypothetical protein